MFDRVARRPTRSFCFECSRAKATLRQELLTAAVVFLSGIGLASFAPRAAAQMPPIQFNRDVRPILSDACFYCHGPDKAKRKSKLHFDSEEGAGVDLGGYFAIVPGKPAESELIRRITTSDPSRRMPPPKAPVALTAKQIATLERWIAEGAAWQKHWAFLPPVRAPLPAVKNGSWPRNSLDRFVLAELERHGLQPAPEADPVTLIRRFSLDLTGLPPTPEEVDAFVAEYGAEREKAVARAVDRLLQSPRYGERMAQRWLDGARYADTNGYQTDGERTMWRWRDWVIEAFNANMPFDRFTLEQLAGDMLPGATVMQKIATGFNRNHRGNSEGGVIPEEFAVEYVVDRVDTTSTVWLGLTAGCARCHDHKYDPISQKEFYQLFAYFNNVPERGKALKYGNSPPYLKTPTREQEARLAELRRIALARSHRFDAKKEELQRAQNAWEKTVDTRNRREWSFQRGLLTHLPLEGAADTERSAPRALLAPASLAAAGTLAKKRFAKTFAGSDFIDAGNVGDFGFFDAFTISAWVFPQGKRGGTILSRMADSDRAEGYSLEWTGGKLHVHLVKRWLDDAIRVETAETLPPDRWHHVVFSYDGSRLAQGIRVHADGVPLRLKVNLDDLNQNFKTEEPFRIGAGGGKESRFAGGITNVRIYDHVLADADVATLANLDSIEQIVALAPAQRTAVQAHKLASFFLEQQAPAPIRRAFKALLAARAELEHFDQSLPTTMVMQEMAIPRDSHVLLRGEYDKKGPRVSPGIPRALPPLPDGEPNNRLGFARWVASRDNPLTPRVAVNRAWQMLFGAGIVKSVEDFGSQGDWPSHPELLDWLAFEFSSGPNAWDVKHLLRLMVTSAAYRQSSRVTPELHQRDPDNRLLARGPRLRLSADVIRDQALFVSGLLVEKLGGASVRPYQPAGLAKELTGTEDYVQDHGPGLYRRSLYTFWKRTIPPPTLTNFDAANRETCVVRESRTNTPLQALNLMNEVTFVEAARVLAERVIKQRPSPDARLALAFRLATAREPNDSERKVLRSAVETHLVHYRADPAAARTLLGVGEAPRDRALDAAEHAAYAAVCNLILNLDEVITKE